MRKLLLVAGMLLLLIVVALSAFVAVMWYHEYTPNRVEVLEVDSAASSVHLDTITIVSWNIGYAGLGDDMDFFYDGGKTMRSSEARTEQNLEAIKSFLQQHTDADFILLQEVDRNSYRSYYSDEYQVLKAALPQFPYTYFAYNYVAAFVPIPLHAPMRGVESGLALFSKAKPTEVVRYQYPGAFSFPTRLFNLKRALLSARFTVEGYSWPFYLNNTHNSAYDNGSMRRGELAFLDSLLSGKPYSVTLGDWNSTPPTYTPSKAELEDKYFSPLPLKATDFAPDLRFVSDTTKRSTRYGYEPFNEKTTTQTLLDFALISTGVECLSIEVIDLKYKSSDHNPVVARFVLKR